MGEELDSPLHANGWQRSGHRLPLRPCRSGLAVHPIVLGDIVVHFITCTAVAVFHVHADARLLLLDEDLDAGPSFPHLKQLERSDEIICEGCGIGWVLLDGLPPDGWRPRRRYEKVLLNRWWTEVIPWRYNVPKGGDQRVRVSAVDA